MTTDQRTGRISRLARDLRPSGIREFFDLVVGMDDVISLGVGEPDFPTPWRICDAVIESLRHGATSYTSNLGLLELREEIARYLERKFGVSYDPTSQILITVGASEAVDLAMRALLDPGDEFLVTDPSYVSYAPCVEMAHGQAVAVRTHLEHEFRIQPGPLADACTGRARGLLFCNPSNPTGAVMRREHLEAVAEVALAKDLLVISDEIYAELTYDGDHCSFPTLPEMYDRTLLLNGFSKADAMTGWRVGYACGPAEIIEAMTRMHAYTTMCVPIMGQIAAVEALRRGEDDRARMVAEYDQRRRVFIKGLNRIGLDCFEPMGAFYAFPSIRATGLSSQQFAKALLADQRVAVVPGDAFGEAGEGHVRCSYASSISDLREALSRIEAFLARLEAGEIALEQ
ncbi:MAG: aminotransferase class I/II-fold pyridoxal phosphate-dependent enzyme [Armatimonadota bacterium]